MALGYGRVSTNNFATAKFIVDTNGISAGATHSTIAAALTSASSGDTIFIKPGTYTENLTLKAGVNLTAASGGGDTPNVTIIGKATATFSGTCTISNIRLQTNSDFFLVNSGSNATVIHLEYCYLNCTNNTGISHTTSNTGSSVNIFHCKGNIGTTGITLFTSTSTGQIIIFYSFITNSGGTTTASSASAGNIGLFFSDIIFPLTTTSTGGINIVSSNIDNQSTNTTSITANGSGNGNIYNTYVTSGSASAISIGATVTIADTTVLSSNTNAITGAGTINIVSVGFNGSSSVVNTTTKTKYNTYVGGITFDGGSNVLSEYTVGTWTPTYIGATSAGSTSYNQQNGYYTRIGNMCFVSWFLGIASATGTGNARTGGLPFTAKNQSNYFPVGPVYTSSVTFGSSRTSAVSLGSANSTNISYESIQSGAAVSTIQIANAVVTISSNLEYQI